MTIGIDARLWNETGVGRYIRNLVKNLQVLDKKNSYLLFVRSQDTENVQQHITNKKWQVIKTDIRWHSLDEQIKFPHLLQQYAMDLMHFPYFSVPIFYTRPYVVTIHDLIIYHFATGKASTLPLPLYVLKQAGYRLVIQQAVKNAKKVIVPLQTTKQDLIQTLRTNPEKVIVTQEGFDEGITVKGNMSRTHAQFKNQKFFLYVGNAYPHKNVYQLIDAYRLFRKETKENVALVLVGKEDYFYKQLEAQVKKQGGAGIHFLHTVSDNELAHLYKDATALIAPSLIEGFGLIPLEAMALSCLVIASNIPAFHEVCEDAALYFSLQDKHHLTKVMHEVLALSTKEKEAYLKKGKERVAQFSWKRMSEQTLQTYESCISLR